MKALIYKEIRLTTPFLYLFSLLAALVIIPNYPKIVSLVYVIWAIGIYLQLKKESRDFEFSATLPVAEKDNILSVILFAAFLEVLQMVLGALFSLISNFAIQPEGNPIGLDLNPAFFGVALLSFAVFNITMFPLFYKNDCKIALPIIAAGILYGAVYAAAELLIAFVPSLAILDSADSAALGWQFMVTAAGAAAFAGSIYVAFKLTCKVKKT